MNLGDLVEEARSVHARNLSVEQLYAALAESAGLGADEIDKSGEGRTLFSRIWHRHGAVICENEAVKGYVANPTVSDSTMISAQVANLLVGLEGVNVVIVACLAVRIGLRTLCGATSVEDPK